MLGWTLVGYPSPNLEVVTEAMAGGSPDEAMQRVAERRFGSVLARSPDTASGPAHRAELKRVLESELALARRSYELERGD
jgi:hypothetical protein